MKRIERSALSFSIKGAVGFLVLISLLATGFIFKDTIATHATVYAGNEAYRQQSFGDAEVYYTNAYLGDTVIAEFNYNLANTYYQQGRYKEAIVYYNRAIKDENGDSIKKLAFANLGNAYLMAGDTIQSLKALQIALLLDKNNTIVRQNYLFVLDKVQANKEEHSGDPKKEQKEKRADKSDSESSPESDEKGKSTNDQSDQEYEVSDKEMENLFDLINQSEKSAQKRMNKSKQKHKALQTDGYAY